MNDLEIIKSLVDCGWKTQDEMDEWCFYCDAEATSRMNGERDVTHKPDCPYVVALKRLGET